MFKPGIENLEIRELPAARVLHLPAIVHVAAKAPVQIIAPVQPGPDAEWHDLNGANPNPGNIVGTVIPDTSTLGLGPTTGVRPWTVWFEVTVGTAGNRVEAGPKPTDPPPPGTYWGHMQVSPVYTQWGLSKDGSVWLRNVADVSAEWTLLATHVSRRVGGAAGGNGPPLGHGSHLPLHDPI